MLSFGQQGNLLRLVPDTAHSQDVAVFTCLRLEQIRIPPIVDHSADGWLYMVFLYSAQNELRRRHHRCSLAQTARHDLAVPSQPLALRWFFLVDTDPPTHHVAVGHDDARNVGLQGAIGKLIGMKQVRFDLVHDTLQVGLGLFYVALRLVHPLQAEAGRAIFKIAQALHPYGLFLRRNLAEADKRDLMTMPHQTAHQFTGVAPDTTDGVRGHQYVHSRSSMAVGACSWMSL